MECSLIVLLPRKLITQKKILVFVVNYTTKKQPRKICNEVSLKLLRNCLKYVSYMYSIE
jgi:hypothetical protein